jgi:hypothetical protein
LIPEFDFCVHLFRSDLGPFVLSKLGHLIAVHLPQSLALHDASTTSARIFPSSDLFQPLTRKTSFVLAPIAAPALPLGFLQIPFYANLLQFSLLQAARPQQRGFLQPHATRNFYRSRSFKPPRPLPLGFLQYLATRNFYSFSTRPNHYRSDFFNSLPREASTALAPSSRPGHHGSGSARIRFTVLLLQAALAQLGFLQIPIPPSIDHPPTLHCHRVQTKLLHYQSHFLPS